MLALQLLVANVPSSHSDLHKRSGGEQRHCKRSADSLRRSSSFTATMSTGFFNRSRAPGRQRRPPTCIRVGPQGPRSVDNSNDQRRELRDTAESGNTDARLDVEYGEATAEQLSEEERLPVLQGAIHGAHEQRRELQPETAKS